MLTVFQRHRTSVQLCADAYDDEDSEQEILFDVPLDKNTSQVTCVVMELEDTDDTNKLYDNTKSIYEKFDPSKVCCARLLIFQLAVMETYMLVLCHVVTSTCIYMII